MSVDSWNQHIPVETVRKRTVTHEPVLCVKTLIGNAIAKCGRYPVQLLLARFQVVFPGSASRNFPAVSSNSCFWGPWVIGFLQGVVPEEFTLARGKFRAAGGEGLQCNESQVKRRK